MPTPVAVKSHNVSSAINEANQQTSNPQGFSMSMAQLLNPADERLSDEQALFEQTSEQSLSEQNLPEQRLPERTIAATMLTLPLPHSVNQIAEQERSTLMAQSGQEGDVSPQGILMSRHLLDWPAEGKQPSQLVYNELARPSLAQIPGSLLMRDNLANHSADVPLVVEQNPVVVPTSAETGTDYERRKEQSTQRPAAATSAQANDLQPQPDNSALAARLLYKQDSNVKSATGSQTSHLMPVLEQPVKVSNNSNQSFNDLAGGDSNTLRTLMNTALAVSNASPAQWKMESLGQNPAQWGQKLLAVLGDKVQLQLGQHLQKAQIRLDPPHLGTIDISITVEHDRTTVNLVASHQQVRDAMQQTIEQLRLSLGAKLGTDVNVSSQADTPDQGQRQKPSGFQPNNILAGQWQEPISESASSFTEQPREWLNRLV